MANAQIKFWNRRRKQKAILVAEILRIIGYNRGQLMTSYEIKYMMTPAILALLQTALSSYSNSGFAEPASHIGSLCAELSQQGLLRHGQKKCTYLNHNDDAFAA